MDMDATPPNEDPQNNGKTNNYSVEQQTVLALLTQKIWTDTPNQIKLFKKALGNSASLEDQISFYSSILSFVPPNSVIHNLYQHDLLNFARDCEQSGDTSDLAVYIYTMAAQITTPQARENDEIAAGIHRLLDGTDQMRISIDAENYLAAYTLKLKYIHENIDDGAEESEEISALEQEWLRLYQKNLMNEKDQTHIDDFNSFIGILPNLPMSLYRTAYKYVSKQFAFDIQTEATNAQKKPEDKPKADTAEKPSNTNMLTMLLLSTRLKDLEQGKAAAFYHDLVRRKAGLSNLKSGEIYAESCEMITLIENKIGERPILSQLRDAHEALANEDSIHALKQRSSEEDQINLLKRDIALWEEGGIAYALDRLARHARDLELLERNDETQLTAWSMARLLRMAHVKAPEEDNTDSQPEDNDTTVENPDVTAAYEQAEDDTVYQEEIAEDPDDATDADKPPSYNERVLELMQEKAYLAGLYTNYSTQADAAADMMSGLLENYHMLNDFLTNEQDCTTTYDEEEHGAIWTPADILESKMVTEACAQSRNLFLSLN